MRRILRRLHVATIVPFLLFRAHVGWQLLGVSMMRYSTLRESQAQHRALFADNPK